MLFLMGWAPPVAAQAVAQASCNAGAPSVKQAQAALDKSPEALSPLVRLADALVDQGCYREAVAVLQKGRVQHPDSAQVAGKLRDVGSMVAEGSYIQGMTDAEDAARQQHAALRCEKMSDLDACNEALKSTPSDVALLLAKGDLLVQGGHLNDAVPLYERATQLDPASSAARDKLAAAQGLARASATAPQSAELSQPARSAAPRRPRSVQSALARASIPAGNMAQAAPAPAAPQTYSNEAPAGRSN
jgi:predicted Zn-dependent protease